MDMQYAPEFSQENIASLIDQYSKTLQPQIDKDLRQVKASSFGQGLGYGSPYQAGVGEVLAGKNNNLAQYGLGLTQQGLQANATGREAALGRQFTAGENALSRQFQTSERTGSQDFQAQQSALQRALQSSQFNQTFDFNKLQAAYQNELSKAGLTGMLGGQQTLAGRQLATTESQAAEEQKMATTFGFPNVETMKAYALTHPEEWANMFDKYDSLKPKTNISIA